jgi:hypothetical protein
MPATERSPLVVREYRGDRPLCMCGCGQPAPLATETSNKYGWVKGAPMQYVLGHATRKRKLYDVDVETGCWNWLHHCTPDGYGRLERDGRRQMAHRYIFELNRGPIPEGMQLDHLCRNRRCVNPVHLEPVSGLVNARRGRGTEILGVSSHRVGEIARERQWVG